MKKEANTLDKKQLIRQISKETGHPNHAVSEIVDTLISMVSEQIASGGRIEIQNFLVLEVVPYWRNMKANGLSLHWKLKAKPSKHIRDRWREITPIE